MRELPVSNTECLALIDGLANKVDPGKTEDMKAIYDYMKANYTAFYVSIEDRSINTTNFLEQTKTYLRGL